MVRGIVSTRVGLSDDLLRLSPCTVDLCTLDRDMYVYANICRLSRTRSAVTPPIINKYPTSTTHNTTPQKGCRVCAVATRTPLGDVNEKFTHIINGDSSAPFPSSMTQWSRKWGRGLFPCVFHKLPGFSLLTSYLVLHSYLLHSHLSVFHPLLYTYIPAAPLPSKPPASSPDYIDRRRGPDGFSFAFFTNFRVSHLPFSHLSCTLINLHFLSIFKTLIYILTLGFLNI